MKKLTLLLCIRFALSLYACSGDDAEETGQEQVEVDDISYPESRGEYVRIPIGESYNDHFRDYLSRNSIIR